MCFLVQPHQNGPSRPIHTYIILLFWTSNITCLKKWFANGGICCILIHIITDKWRHMRYNYVQEKIITINSIWTNMIVFLSFLKTEFKYVSHFVQFYFSQYSKVSALEYFCLFFSALLNILKQINSFCTYSHFCHLIKWSHQRKMPKSVNKKPGDARYLKIRLMARNYKMHFYKRCFQQNIANVPSSTSKEEKLQ